MLSRLAAPSALLLALAAGAARAQAPWPSETAAPVTAFDARVEAAQLSLSGSSVIGWSAGTVFATSAFGTVSVGEGPNGAGDRAVFFDGASYLSDASVASSALTSTTASTTFAVIRSQGSNVGGTSGTRDSVYGWGTSSNRKLLHFVWDAVYTWQHGNPSSGSGGGGAVLDEEFGEWLLVSNRVTGGTTSGWLNGRATGAGTVGALTAGNQPMRIGSDTFNNHFHGSVAQLLFFDYAMTDEAMAATERYLKCLYPSAIDHPASCCTADDSPATPELDADASTVADGNLEVVFHSALDRYTATGWRFVGATDGACGDAASAGLNGWTHTDGECARTHKLTVPVTEALKECGFSAEPEDGGSVWYYEAVVEATTQEPNGTVFGEDTTRTVTTAFRVRVELPKSVDVSASAVAYGAVIQFALLSRQEVDTSTPTAAFKWTLVTSVQHPYELAAKDVTEESGHVFESLGLSLSAASVACPASGACTQTFEIAATESTSCELTGAQLKSVFTIGCRSQFTGACDTPEGDETDATFTVSTDSFCARVVEVATVTPTLTTSTSQGGASAADFVLQTTLFGRVTFAIEAGLSVTSTRLLSLDLVSEETVKPVTGAGVQDSAVVSAISFVESDQGGTAPHLDFQFQLNTDSVKFAVGGGQASMTITAVVEVTYDGAASQRFEVQAVSGPGSVSTAASSTVGVSTPAAPGSASTAGSTVLGVSTGTAMVAGVGLVAVVALAAGAAVVGRNRRASAAAAAAKRASSSTASLSIALEEVRPAAAAVPGAVTFAAGEEELGRVRDAYGAL